MNSLVVHFLQLSLIFMIWYHAINETNFIIIENDGLEVICVRFIASMLMHLNVEKDVRNGIQMMKYAVNHSENFVNLDVGFFIGFMLTICSFGVEITVILVLVSFRDVLKVVMGYVSLAAISNIPRFYYNSLVEHKLLTVADVTLAITKFRHMNPRENAPFKLHVMRFIQKSNRLFFVSWSYYFMPFTALIISFFRLEIEK